MKALTSGKWSLRYDSIAQQPNEQLTFDRDGAMAMQGFKCEWRMIGPRAICIYPLHKAILLKLNDDLTQYSAVLAGGDSRYSGARIDRVALPAPASKPFVNGEKASGTPAPPESATKLTRLLLEHDWTHGRFRTGILHFNDDHFGTLTNGKDGVRRFSWKELGEFTARIVMIDGGTDAGKVGSEATYTFASDGSGYGGVGFGGSADTGGSRHRSSDHASVSTASPPAANPTTPRTYGSSQEEALFGHNWSWETVANGRTIVVQFLEDGRVSGGWHWQWFPKPGGELLVDCFWGEKEHMYLKFDQRFTGFEGYNPGGGLETRGRRLDAIVPGGR